MLTLYNRHYVETNYFCLFFFLFGIPQHNHGEIVKCTWVVDSYKGVVLVSSYFFVGNNIVVYMAMCKWLLFIEHHLILVYTTQKQFIQVLFGLWDIKFVDFYTWANLTKPLRCFLIVGLQTVSQRLLHLILISIPCHIYLSQWMFLQTIAFFWKDKNLHFSLQFFSLIEFLMLQHQICSLWTRNMQGIHWKWMLQRKFFYRHMGKHEPLWIFSMKMVVFLLFSQCYQHI